MVHVLLRKRRVNESRRSDTAAKLLHPLGKLLSKAENHRRSELILSTLLTIYRRESERMIPLFGCVRDEEPGDVLPHRLFCRRDADQRQCDFRRAAEGASASARAAAIAASRHRPRFCR